MAPAGFPPPLPRRFADYPLLELMLASILCQAHRDSLAGLPVKMGFVSTQLIKETFRDCGSDVSFWQERLTAYRISRCRISPSGLGMYLETHLTADLFEPDSFLLITPPVYYDFDVNDHGVLTWLQLQFVECGPPGFLLELVRDFPGSGRGSDVELDQAILRQGIEPDATFTAPRELSKAIRIEV